MDFLLLLFDLVEGLLVLALQHADHLLVLVSLFLGLLLQVPQFGPQLVEVVLELAYLLVLFFVFIFRLFEQALILFLLEIGFGQ